MFFILSKLLYFIITPTIWIIALFLLSLFSKKEKLKKRFLVSGIILFFFFTNNFIFNIAVKQWEMKVHKFGEIEKKYKYGVVLGGMATSNLKTGVVQFSPGIDRLLQAITLYKKGNIEKIFITGGTGAVFDQNNKESCLLHKICLNLEIPDSVLTIEFKSKNTYENAIFTKQILGTGYNILLITSGFHMRRAAACFKHEGFKFDVLSTDPLEKLNMSPDDYFIPKPYPLDKWAYLIKEWVGYVSYKTAGYI
jgi:uncharacterized SAM-binding protein YcdF (DUF218 family)